MSDPLTIADGVIAAMPPWLRRTRGARLVRGLVDVFDVIRERSIASLDARLPGGTASALGVLGRDRRIARGLVEPDAGYATRLRTWRQSHRRRGSAVTLLEQVRGMWSAVPTVASVIGANRLRHTLALDGTITRHDTDVVPLAAWARAAIIYHAPAHSTMSYQRAATYYAVALDWAPAHIATLRVYAISAGGDCLMWGYPEPVAKWGSGATWGCAVDIGDIVALGPSADAARMLTIDGEPMTLEGSEVLL